MALDARAETKMSGGVTMPAFDTSGIPDVARREEAARLWDAATAARAVLDALPEIELTSETRKKLSDLDASYYAKCRAMHEQHELDKDAILNADQASNDHAASKAWKDAARAYEDFDAPDIVSDENDEIVVRCAKTGVPIFDTDEILEDPETCEVYLRAAFGLPPREVDAEQEEAA